MQDQLVIVQPRLWGMDPVFSKSRDHWVTVEQYHKLLLPR